MNLSRALPVILGITIILTAVCIYLMHLPIWLAVLFALAIQYIGNWMYQGVLVLIYGIQTKKYEVELAKEVAFQSIEVECPCSIKNKQMLLFRLNQESYECEQCKKTINLKHSISTFLKTSPVSTDAETVEKILQEAKLPTNVGQNTN